MEISAIQDDVTKMERIVAWCAMYPGEIPFALGFFRDRFPRHRVASNQTGGGESVD